ncbi:MAG: folylpolyglutamate synthase/dihydrofolate synthase family protein [Candidatus Aminicenantales bacterium]
MNYAQSQKYLQEIQSLGIKLGLDNIRALLSSLNNPHQEYPSVIVAGTNGKGSVCAMLAQILAEHRLRVGLYTSPHLVRAEERIRVMDEPIPPRDFCRCLTVIKEKVDVLLNTGKLNASLTFFEVLTSVAFLYFAQQKVDIAILEVGMGGRFDATNVGGPLVSVIVTVSRDHQEFLGGRLRQIAFEKAGIIKPGVPVICGDCGREALRVIQKRAAEMDAPFTAVFNRPECFQAEKTAKAYQFTYSLDGKKYVYTPFLKGKHQGMNAAVAVAVASELSRSWRKLEKRKIIRGIEKARWEGRLETLSRKPLLLLDGAHNEAGAKVIRSYILDFISPPLILVFAMMENKKIQKVARILFPLAQKVICTHFPYFRAASPEKIRDQTLEFKDRIICEPDVQTAVRKARIEAGIRGCVLVTGSLFLVGEVKKLFR